MRKSWIGFLAVLLVFNAGLLTEILLYSTNTLYRNNAWSVSKRQLEMGVMGGDEFLMTRSPLASNELNLGAWYGYQEVILKNLNGPEEIYFGAVVPKNSYLDLIFEKTATGFSGVRISRHPKHPSLLFKADGLREFKEKQTLDELELKDDALNISLQSNSAGLVLEVNKKFVALRSTPVGPGQIGFRSGEGSVTIDNVAIHGPGGRQFHDNFRNSQDWLRVAGGHALVLWILFFMPLLGLVWYARESVLGYLQGASIFALLVATAGTVYFFADFYVFSAQPYQARFRKLNTAQEFPEIPKLELLRHDTVGAWSRFVGMEFPTREGVVARGYLQNRFWAGPFYCPPSAACKALSSSGLTLLSPNPERVVLLGTSQTVGAGADHLSESLSSVLARLLAIDHPQGDLINLAASGAQLKSVVEAFEKIADGLKPAVVIANFSNNDTPETLRADLPKLIELTGEKNMELVLLEEANSDETSNQQSLANHEILRELSASSPHVKVLPFHGYMSEPTHSGQIWWDYVHMTSYGQKQAAQWLAPHVRDALKRRRENAIPN